MDLLIKDLYNNHLKEICGFQFTLREIDVIACILHNRGEKKIATMLGISPSTVNTHIYNVMSKLGYHSRESIIDFIEGSKKIAYVKKYYFYVLANGLFRKYLQKINALNPQKYVCIIYTGEETARHKQILSSLTECLKLANIKVINSDGNLHQACCSIYVINSKVNITKNNSDLNKINVLLDNVDISGDKDFQYIDFRNTEDFHNSVFILIKQILGTKNISSIFENFKNEYQSFQDSWGELGVIKQNIYKPDNHKKFTKLLLWKIIIIMIILALFIIGVKSFLQNNPFVKNSCSSNNGHIKLYDKLNEMFSIIDKYKLSADNLTSENLHKNYSIIKRFEEVDKNYTEQELQNYFLEPEHNQKLVKYLYIMHAAATYYNYHEYDHDKALTALSKAVNITQIYINNMNKTEVNFDSLPIEELLHELDVIKELPEIYARILYTLGRSYMLQNNFQKAIYYFTKAEYLGNELQLFEGYLSKYKGLMEIELATAKNDIQNKDYQTAKIKLLQLAKLYEDYKTYQRKYKINYEPYKEPKVVALQDTIRHMVECGAKLIQVYSMLLTITDSEQQKSLYAELVFKQFSATDSYAGILSYLDKVNNRKKADIFNIIGNSLLLLYDNLINLEPIKNIVSKYCQFTKSDDLSFIKQLFELAKVNSRTYDCTRFESLNGLMKINKKSTFK